MTSGRDVPPWVVFVAMILVWLLLISAALLTGSSLPSVANPGYNSVKEEN